MQQNLTDKIYNELDMIRLLSRISKFVVSSDNEVIKEDSFNLIFKDIENRCWQIAEWVEEMCNNKIRQDW